MRNDIGPPPSTVLKARLISIARESEWFWPALVAVRGLQLPSWCIGAGAVRNLVWDSLHEFRTPSALSDVDVAYFDASDLSTARDAELERRLVDDHPDIPWEVTNQAAVHEWYEARFGHAVSPLVSLEDAVASWPELATSVGITLHADDSIDVIAPHGLDDLFAMVVRRNPTRVSVETYRQRVEQKQYRKRWPRVIVVPC
ncbi:nucleotidyltransferase family protein [Paraburkholderia bryophila]|uniref:nucleotidyltransferase family protein n=1 Tax=Paraburkholderia bryophila TaxID=420952 RepID=UPI0023497832|nr:nucleotidyltransferase family protein [Paraburkholderia bryophila]WCM22867.1 nucleotidyltransferase family protein [Paraburkholderia bryophila]